MRDLPATIRETIERPNVPDAMLAFLTIEHENLTQPIRVVNDGVDYLRDGHLWNGLPFGARAATDTDAAPTAELRVQNVDRKLGEAVRTLPGRARARLEVLSSADFDLGVVPRVALGVAVPIYAMRHFELAEVTVTPLELTATLILRDYAQEPWPGLSATETRCPGLYR